MKKKEVRLLFSFPLSRLNRLGNDILRLTDRDEAEFADRGFTPERRQELADQLNAFIDFPTDEELDGYRQAATEKKNELRSQLEVQMRALFNMAANKYGNHSARYRSFGPGNISQQIDETLLRTTKVMAATARRRIEALATEGLTADKIERLEAAARALDAALDEQFEATSNRDVHTEDRAAAANTLYANLVKYAGTGRAIWASESEAKYNDYIIYDTPSGEKEGEKPTQQ